MSVDIVTKSDLQEFRMQLLEDLKKIFGKQPAVVEKKWLKSTEVRKLLGISAGKLQTLRINGKLPHCKVGGTMYYKYQDVENLLETA